MGARQLCGQSKVIGRRQPLLMGEERPSAVDNRDGRGRWIGVSGLHVWRAIVMVHAGFHPDVMRALVSRRSGQGGRRTLAESSGFQSLSGERARGQRVRATVKKVQDEIRGSSRGWFAAKGNNLWASQDRTQTHHKHCEDGNRSTRSLLLSESVVPRPKQPAALLLLLLLWLLSLTRQSVRIRDRASTRSAEELTVRCGEIQKKRGQRRGVRIKSRAQDAWIVCGPQLLRAP